jgi:hypothetical protein
MSYNIRVRKMGQCQYNAIMPHNAVPERIGSISGPESILMPRNAGTVIREVLGR